MFNLNILKKTISYSMNSSVYDSLMEKAEWNEYGFNLESAVALLYFILMKYEDNFELFCSGSVENKEKIMEEIDLSVFYKSIKENIPEGDSVCRYEAKVNRVSSIFDKEEKIISLLEKKLGIPVNRDVIITASAILLFNLFNHFLLGENIYLVNLKDKGEETIIFDEEDLFNFTGEITKKK